ncbi:hypothetical protein OH492_15560 [Vibrio chagasii]|nr:hypothetical protein [Vibrio chagasii]
MDNGQQFACLAEATFVDDNDEAQRDPNDFGSEYTAIRESSISTFSRTGTRLRLKWNVVRLRQYTHKH